jgi:hypothetical protein
MGITHLINAGVKTLEVSVSEAPVQMATFRAPVPQTEEELVERETRTLFRPPKPCFAEDA